MPFCRVVGSGIPRRQTGVGRGIGSGNRRLCLCVVFSAMLVLGQIDLDEAQRAVSDATESEPRPLRATEFGFDINTEAIRFEHLAGAAGLATIAWQ